jgi:hypothetical protein
MKSQNNSTKPVEPIKIYETKKWKRTEDAGTSPV